MSPDRHSPNREGWALHPAIHLVPLGRGGERPRRLGSPSDFLRLGCTSFGGPVAHIGYFRAEFVERRRWVTEGAFADLVALCQFMPGPASSQLGMSIGLLRAGPLGMLAAWVGFTLPSALAMLAFAYGVEALGDVSNAAWLKGLKLVAVAVVAQAVWGMAQSLAPDRPRAPWQSRPRWSRSPCRRRSARSRRSCSARIIGLTLLPTAPPPRD